jgi:hypothetical protein
MVIEKAVCRRSPVLHVQSPVSFAYRSSAGEPFLDDFPCLVGAAPPVNGHLVVLPLLIGHEEVRDLLHKLLGKIGKVLHTFPVRILARRTDHLRFAFVLVA